ncbi:mannose-6-phosphate isomerase, class I [Pneumocystis jirovecii RU7]|uniref:Mannose-6-phosphate isomerase n=1 Tax=Pneumocystis jirovecii (strain RU7) TaxID=1408657 RepID=A0A0W4ZCX5_PNEJ7|nr:mannose-6-phosphate isomerase, class I [Pneumocystis jirovecii RU7]KTW26253.1 mannose-6-phosphate isomerase, class I [Pneumocystis jirovecii RU7]
MAIALTPFEALCGFRPIDEIISFVMKVRGFRRLLGSVADVFVHEEQARQRKYEKSINYECTESLQSQKALQTLLHTLLIQPTEHVEACVKQLLLDIHERAQDEENIYKDLYEVILRLNDQFPGDIGIFCVFLLNHVRLMPGEGIFLKANTPHAYLCGEAIECMSSSDNVVRAGLTPKFKDVETLVSMLTYKCASASEQKMAPVRFDRTVGDGEVYFFKPPINEFNVLQIRLKKGNIQTIEGLKGPSIMICTQGDGTVVAEEKLYSIRTGLVFFVGAFVETVFTANSDSFIIYRAFVEV